MQKQRMGGCWLGWGGLLLLLLLLLLLGPCISIPSTHSAKPAPLLWDRPLASRRSRMLNMASCHLVSSLPPPFFLQPLYKHKSPSLLLSRPRLLRRLERRLDGNDERKASGHLWRKMTTKGMRCFFFKWLHLAKGHGRGGGERLIWKWKHGVPALSYIIPTWIFCLCAGSEFLKRRHLSAGGVAHDHTDQWVGGGVLIGRVFAEWRCPWGGRQVKRTKTALHLCRGQHLRVKARFSFWELHPLLPLASPPPFSLL